LIPVSGVSNREFFEKYARPGFIEARPFGGGDDVDLEL
jgi:hypothetical protein